MRSFPLCNAGCAIRLARALLHESENRSFVMHAAIGVDGPILRQEQSIHESKVTSFFCFSPTIICSNHSSFRMRFSSLRALG